MADRNLILGLAAGYHLGDVGPFLRSLSLTGCESRCVLFVSDTTRDLDRMAALGAEIVPSVRTAALDNVPYNALRYFLYRGMLRREDDFDRVLLTDVRDVVFQTDPFAFSWPDGVNVVLEDPSVALGECPHNSRWTLGHLGATAFDVLRDKTISCSGTVMADKAGAMAYLRAMTERLLPPPDGERMAGYDQGVHNLLVHTGKLPGVVFHDNDGPVLTLGQTDGEPALDEDGFVINRLGRRPHIVHQYDRKPGLHRHFRRRFAAPAR